MSERRIPGFDPNKDTHANTSSRLGITSFTTQYGKHNPPVWIGPKAGTMLSAEGSPADPNTHPEIATPPENRSRLDVVNGALGSLGLSASGLPEIRPFFLNLRSRLTDKKISKLEASIEEETARSKVLQHVGKSIILGKAYRGDNKKHPLSPVGDPKARKAAKKLELHNHHMEGLDGERHNIWRTYGRDIDEANATPGRSLKEKAFPNSSHIDRPPMGKWAAGVNTRAHNRHQRHIDHAKHEMVKILAEPSRRAKELQKQHEKVVLKHAAIQKLRWDKAAEKQSKIDSQNTI